MNMSKMEKTSLAVGLFFGATGIILGAVGSHALKGYSEEMLKFFQIGNRYQVYHALFLLVLGLLERRYQGKLMNLSIFGTIAGTVLFSGSLYLLTLANIKISMIFLFFKKMISFAINPIILKLQLIYGLTLQTAVLFHLLQAQEFQKVIGKL